ncbi:hypothetical protein [Caldithrix abyssi]|nr:hypothetical protein [Caldithrix abyssi]
MMNNKLGKILLALALGVFVLSAWQIQAGDGKAQGQKHPELDYSISCTECHEEVTPEIVAEWKSSKHGMMNFGCYMCHGDGQVEFKAKPDTEGCLSCHTGSPVDASKGGNLQCFTCHQGHTLKFHQ